MRVIHIAGSFAVVLSVLSLASCKGGSRAKEVPLSELGGAIQLKHVLQRGEKFTYETQYKTVVKGAKSYDYATTVERQIEVAQTGGQQSKLKATITKAEVVSDDKNIEERRRSSHQNEVGIAIDLTCDRSGAILSASAAGDSEAAKELQDEYASDPALFGIAFPGEKLTIGSKWAAYSNFAKFASSIPSLDAEAASKVPINFTLAGAEEQDGRKLAVIDYSIDSTIGQVRNDQSTAVGVEVTLAIKAHGKARVDIATGMLFDDDYELEYRIEGLSRQSIKVTGQVRRKAGR